MKPEDSIVIEEKAKTIPPPPAKKLKIPRVPPQGGETDKRPDAASKIRDIVDGIIGVGKNYLPHPNDNPPVNPKLPDSGKYPPPPKKDEPPKIKPPKLVKPSPWYGKKELGNKAILFTKEGRRMRFLCDFSNNFRDRDNPPEILSSAAHERFVKEVDACEWPMPELWWWHMDGTRLGQADWMGYDKENGITLASGLVDKGMESIADSIDHYPEKIGTSHGMVVPLLERDVKDKSTITRYVSREISALPARAAANTLTEILIGKEINMALSQDKIESLKALGFSAEQIADVEARNKAKAEEAKAAGIESKETEAPAVEPAPEVETPSEVPAEVPAVEPAAEPVAEIPVVEKPVTQTELKQMQEAMVKAVVEIIKPLQAEQNRFGAVLKGIESKAREDAKKELSMTPTASLLAMFAHEMKSAGNPANAVDGRSSLVKSGPDQAPSESVSMFPPFLQKIIADSEKQA